MKSNMEILLICCIGLYFISVVYSCDTCGYYKKYWYRNMGWCSHFQSRLYVGDFNGDKQTDMMCHDNAGTLWTSLAQADGSFITTSWNSGSFKFCKGSESANSNNQLLVGDFNGDGRSDLLCHCKKTGDIAILPADVEQGFKGDQWRKNMRWCKGKNAQLFIGDFDGNIKDDMLCHRQDNGYKEVAFNKGKKGKIGFTSTDWHHKIGWCKHKGSRLYVGDFNGDGKSDILCSDNRGRKWISYAKTNLKTLFIRTDWHQNFHWCHENGNKVFMRIADVNGDNKDDLICHKTPTGQTWVVFSQPDNGFSRYLEHYKGGWCSRGESEFIVGKFNNDNRADMLCHSSSTGKKWINYSECH